MLSEYFIGKPIRVRKVTIDEIVEAVAEQFQTTSVQIKGPGRHERHRAGAAHVAMHLCRELMPELKYVHRRSGVRWPGIMPPLSMPASESARFSRPIRN